MTSDHIFGDEWTNHYRGYRLQTNPDGDVWWQAYQGTDRLFLNPTPESIVDSLLDLKHLGGRVRITEDNDVITRIEEDDEYSTVWVGEASLSGDLVPADEPEYSIPVAPENVESGALWPSVYDGAKYSFAPGAERIWCANPNTHRRHPVETPLPNDVTAALSRYKPRGGSFRITPWNDVLTLVDIDQLSPGAKAEFDDLPRVVKNLISLRKNRGGVEKIPIYVGEADTTPLRVSEPPSLTDPITADELGLEGWTESLGTTTETDPEAHSIESPAEESETDTDNQESTAGRDDDSIDIPDDDPIDW